MIDTHKMFSLYFDDKYAYRDYPCIKSIDANKLLLDDSEKTFIKNIIAQ